MTNLAIARPSYIIETQAAKEAAKLEEAYQSFRKSDAGWEAWSKGGRALRSKKVLVEGHVVTRYYEGSPNPYKKESFGYRAWKEGYDYTQGEDEMGYDL